MFIYSWRDDIFDVIYLYCCNYYYMLSIIIMTVDVTVVKFVNIRIIMYINVLLYVRYYYVHIKKCEVMVIECII